MISVYRIAAIGGCLFIGKVFHRWLKQEFLGDIYLMIKNVSSSQMC